MSDKKPKSPIEYVTDIESVRLTNWFIRMAWRATALTITVIVRLLTAIPIAILRSIQRNRMR